jgi:putative ABC transport system permease protein
MAVPRIAHILRIGFKSIGLHALRSALTVVSIVLGVASVIVMLAVGEGARFRAIQQIKDMGATNIIVRSVKPLEDPKQRQQEGILTYGLTYRDLERIRETIPTIVSVTPLREFRKDIRVFDRSLEGRVVSVMPNYLETNGLKMAQGRFITDLDNEKYENVVVLGAETAEVLFPVDDPIGKSVRVGENHYYRVIGVTEKRSASAGIGGSLTAQDYNRDVYIPFDTDRVRFGSTLFYVKAGTYQMERLDISQITVAVDSMTHVRKTATILQCLLDQFHTQKDVSIVVPLDLLQKAEETQRLFTIVLGAIASISLIVGGIGIMNIMLATVTERTREIGIRRALGAKRRDIANQFLAESMLLSSTGGLIGIALGVLLSILVAKKSGMPTIIQPWSPFLAFTVSVGVGLVFGTYPARRAAHMDPIEALRHQ